MDGVEKRIDALAMAIQMGATVYDLEEAELCYAPPFGSAKDPVNFAGMVPANVLRGDMPLCSLGSLGDGFLLDVRNPPELAVESVPGAVNFRCQQLRDPPGELPRDREILRHLPLRRACLLRDAHPDAERVQGHDHLRRHAVAFDDRGRSEMRKALGGTRSNHATDGPGKGNVVSLEDCRSGAAPKIEHGKRSVR